MLVIHYAVRLELAAAEGWFGEARRVLETEAEGPEHGYGVAGGGGPGRY